jgi:membrane protease YdiL (CAAX protease family)
MQRVNNEGLIILLKFNTVIILIIAALMLISFPLGVYIVFIHSDHALLNDTYTLISMPVKIELNIGYLFIIAWFIYIILFVMILLKPKDIVKVTLSIMQSKNSNNDNKRMLKNGMISVNSKSNYIDKANTIAEIDRNLLMITIAWFSIFTLASKGIDTIQSAFGITMGSLEAEYDNYIRYFIDASIAPLKEEFAFRIILIGLPTYILLAKHDVSLTSVLWHPYSKIDMNKERIKGKRGGAAFIIAVSAVLFALAHILFSSGWSYGKIPQAMLGGLILGWLYYRYGFPTAVILHWAINYMLLAYLLFNNGIISGEGYPLINTTHLYYNGSNTFIYIIELLVIINGITALAIILMYNLKSYIVRLSSWFKLLVDLIFIHLR